MADTIRDDLIWGVGALAAEIGREPRQVYYLLNNGALPARKVGGRWCASRRRLREFLTGEEAA